MDVEKHILEISDENLLEMVKKKMSDCEFRRCLYWVIEEWKNMQS